MSRFIPKTPYDTTLHAALLPGISTKTMTLTERLLEKNNHEHHAFFNDRGFHNHLMHHILAAYSFGANEQRLQEIYDSHASYQRALPEPKLSLTRDNYKDHLGQVDAYPSFLKLFNHEIEQNGMVDTLRRWVWSGDMLTRTLGGVFHPLIHIGYGVEFDIPALVSEGLAMAACTETHFSPVVPTLPVLNNSYLVPVQAANVAASATHSARGMISQLTSQFGSRFGLETKPTEEGSKKNILVDIINEIRTDTSLNDVVSPDEEVRFMTVLKSSKAIAKIKECVARWTIQENQKEIEERLHELYSAALLVFGGSAIREQGVKPDFFLMHAVTSAYFMHLIIPRVSPHEAITLLHGHLASTLVLFISAGRPTLQVDLLLNYESPQTPKGLNNPWTNVLDRSLTCDEAHVIKTVRACALGQILFGHCGDHDDMWLKTAQMIVDNVKDIEGWNFGGIGFDSTWRSK